MNIIKTNLKYSKPLTPIDPKKVFFIVVHHPAAKSASPEQIHEWHLGRGWLGAGYNWYIRKDGTVYELRGWHIGAQTENMNSKSLGVCFEGNYDQELIVPDAQLKAGAELIKYLLTQLPNKVEVVPHGKFQPTACPGKYFPIQKLLKCVNQTSLESALAILEAKGVISSPQYWKDCVTEDIPPDPKYLEKLIENMAQYITKG